MNALNAATQEDIQAAVAAMENLPNEVREWGAKFEALSHKKEKE
jgi:hypothetical protein